MMKGGVHFVGGFFFFGYAFVCEISLHTNSEQI